MGVVSLLNSILVLLIIPFVFNTEKLNKGFLHSSRHKFLFWLFFFNCLVLGWIGGKSIETPYYEIGQIATLFYFAYFFLLFLFDLINTREIIISKKIVSVNFLDYFLLKNSKFKNEFELLGFVLNLLYVSSHTFFNNFYNIFFSNKEKFGSIKSFKV
jgi:hypothetical protein